MDIEETFETATFGLVRRPASLLPVFLAESGLSVVTQTVVTVAAALAYLSLLGTGRIEAVVDTAREVDLSAVGDVPDSGTVTPADALPSGPATEALGEAVMGLFTPAVVISIALGVAGAFALGLVIRALVGAGKVHAARAVMVDGDPTLAAVEGAGRHLRPFLGLVVLQTVLIFGPLLFGLVVVGLGALVAGPAALGAGSLVFVLGLVLAAPLALVAYVLFLFVPEAIVVEDLGLVAAVRRNLSFLGSHPARGLVLVGTQVVLLGSLVAIGGVLNLLNLPRMVTLFGLLFVSPWTGLLKMALYVEGSAPALPTEGGVFDRFLAGMRRGLAETGRFVVDGVGYVALALAVFLGGTALGWWGASAVAVSGPIEGAGTNPFGTIPLDDAVNIAANNWAVAISHAFAGVGFGLPTVGNLAFNGLIVGALGGVGLFDVRVFAAFILPHGVIEVPALSVSGGLGLFLGAQTVRYLRGSINRAALAATIQRAFYVLLGLLPVFVVAGFVEAFFTPVVGDLVRSSVGG